MEGVAGLCGFGQQRRVHGALEAAEAVRINAVHGAVHGIAVQIHPARDAARVRVEEPAVGRRIERGPHEVQPVAILHDAELADERERVGCRPARLLVLAIRKVAILVQVAAGRIGEPGRRAESVEVVER